MDVAYQHLTPDMPMPDRLDGPVRVALICEVPTDGHWRDQVCEWLVASRCLYFIAWGIDCEDWHDRVDWTLLQRLDYGEIPDTEFIMTTWHADEPLSEALWLAAWSASHPDVAIERTVLLHISLRPEEARLLAAFDRAFKGD